MAKTKVTAPQNTKIESKADIKKKIQILGDEYATAIKDHQKASNDVRRIQSQQKESEKRIQRLKALHQMHQKPKIQKPKPAFQKKIQEKEEAHKKIQKQLKKALKVEESAKDAMEEAEASWKFEAMCSGEAYQENGQWKWRE
ncbi:Protein CBG24179 [Caenorhabditis briggsae]|uniref:Uncharacterized protein n=2 Tax=Caenorhabditis briggsae TaxID=6238 RepID=A0AAE9J0F9_CAEBR|nr:Protein CBG24179 [Caenorhabditis briggsae]ULU13870.1 hypothetical protein L3Y34_016397 [Caenorhabditis briggsae]CAP20847.1 Protein CBG24179 [Caenorhabditis briggsae]